MKKYEVSINGQTVDTVHATKARIAINKVMAYYKESLFTPSATVMIRCRGVVKYTYVVKATQRDEGEESGTMFKRLDGLGPYKTAREAREAADTINTTARDVVNPTTFGAKVYKMDEEGRVCRV